MVNTNISTHMIVGEKTSGLLTVGTYQLLIKVIVFIGLPIAAFGTAGNIINVIVYTKMGFTESTNISLTALACSDLGVVLTAVCTEIIFFLPIVQDVSIAPEVSFTLVAFPHVILTRTSALITAFISIERFLCVLVPLKIRQIITPKRTFIIMAVIFTAVISPMVVVYFRYPLGWRYFPEQNRSRLGVLPINDIAIETSFFIFQVYSSTILPISSFVIISFCTVLLSVNLRRSKKWRESNRGNRMKTSNTNETDPSTSEASKENKAIKMVVAIATVFIISSIPSCIHIVMVMMFPEFDITGRYASIFIITGNAFFVGDTINCSANIVIYYKMSSKFRQAAQELFGFKPFPLRSST